MNNCVSVISADFKSLYSEVFGNEDMVQPHQSILASYISTWQDQHGLESWPTRDDILASMEDLSIPGTDAQPVAFNAAESLKMRQAAKGIKKGVSELFESNPELANSVYAALGFTGAISLESNLKNTGKTEQELIEYLQEKYPEIKLNISNNPVWEKGDNVFNQEEYNNQVNYRLRATEILLSDKAKQVFAKGDKNGWDLNKILTELAIPKGQKQLLLELGVTDREQLALELAGKYGYTIEINTATIKGGSPHARNENEYPEFEYNGEYFTRQGGYFLKDTSPTFDNAEIIFTDEYFEALEKSGITATHSKYHSNLTVPGGTNYRENAIRIPGVVNVISADGGYHDDQFNQSRGDMAGWFRSDDKAVEGTGYNPNELYEDENGNLISGLNRGTPTKTRRILEIQSFFQKVRDKENLIYKPLIKGELFKIGSYPNSISYGKDEKGFYKHSVGKLKEYISKEEFENSKPINSENQFLQLLNKDNNWVTFFIKSIIQDSAKKGYEKVLFPKGETAAKIEGHQTIADEINTKNRVITQLKVNRDIQQQVLDNIDNDTENFISGKNKYFASINTVYTGIGNEAKLTVTSDGKEEYNISTIKDKNWKLGSKEEFALIVKNHIKKEYATKVKDLNNRIEQLEKEKAELKSQGIEKLKPIEAFYDIKVGNILEKQFGKDNVKTITDEYGNSWYEISINQARDLANILLQRNEANQIIGQANIKAMTVLIDAINKKADTIPHEYAHHYIAWFRDTPIVQEGIKRFGSEEALVQAIGEQVVKQKGEAYNWWKKFTNFILSLLSDKQLLQILTDSFLNRTDLNTDFTYNNITPEQKQQAQQLYSQYLDTVFPDSEVSEMDNSLYISVLNQLEQENKIEKDCSGGKLKAKDGIRGKFTKGSQWEIVKDLKGYPSHSQGGVDVKIGKNGFSFTRDNGVIEAKHGLVLPNKFEDPIEFEAISKVLSQRNKHLNWVDRGLNPDKYPKIDNQDDTFSTHRLAYSTGDNGEAYVYPTIIQNDKGELEQLDDNAAWEYAKKTKTAMRIPNVKLAEYYSKNGLIKH